MTFRTWAAEATLIDRRIDGPTRCCGRDFVAADMLVHFGLVRTTVLAQIRVRFPHLATVGPDDLYLCDACRSTLERERILSRAETPRRVKR
jgi:hypothetical protein